MSSSGGEFLKTSPHQDVLDIIDQLPSGFKDAATRELYSISPSKLYLIGVSFGGPAAILASADDRVDKAIAVSSVVDWRFPSEVEPLDWLYSFLREGFGRGYNVYKNTWKKLAGGKFYNPMNYIDDIEGEKILMIHTKDDEVAPYKPAREFAEKVNAELVSYKKGGHLSTNKILKPPVIDRIWNFLRS